MFKDLQSFISRLRSERDLVEIDAEVDPHLEAAEIHRRVIAANGPALLFKNVKGKKFPLVTNLFGTKKRVDLAFGQRPEELIKRIAGLPERLLPPSMGKIWGERDLGLQLLKVGMKETRATVMESEIAGADPTELPAITSWIEDGGPFLTLPLVHTSNIHGGPDNLGMYRMQIHDKKEMGAHFQIGKGGGFHLHLAENEGKPLPMNVYLGGPPALILSAIAPLPENVPEMMLASLVMGDKLGRTKIPGRPDNPSLVANAEFCLVGEVPAKIRRPEGPFGDHYGYYSLQHDYPVFRPHKIYHRKNAIFPATVVGKPRQEDFFIGDYLQELLSPLFPLVMPAVSDIWSYGETGYHALAGAVLKERYGREAMGSVFRILGEGQLSLTKFLIGVGKPIDLHDFKAVLTHALARADFRKDLFIFSDVALDTLDYTGPEVNKGSKGVLLGMGDPIRTLPRVFSGRLPHWIKRAEVYAPGCLVVEIPGFEEDPAAIRQVADVESMRDWPLVVAVDDAAKATRTDAAFLWTTFTRFEPAADIHARESHIVRNKISYTPPIVIDARFKPWYPAELFCDEKTAKTVTARWKEYFPSGTVTMGDSDGGHLYQ